MNGFRAEQRVEDGNTVWVLYSLDTQQVIAKGKTVQEAVEKLVDRND